MKTRTVLPLIALALVAALAVRATRAPGKPEPPGRVISGPYAHANLAVYLIHGPDALPGRNFLTLEEALAAKKAIVRETGTVNELAIENVSAEDDVYVQAGDIVRGGRQDRTIPWDTVVERGTSLPLASFCVEAGRWTARKGEASDHFESAENALATKELKLAAKMQASQTLVWHEVEEAQKALSAKMGEEVNDRASTTSLELALDNGKVRASADEYVRALEGIAGARPDAIGFAFAIDGKLNSADVYASAALFRKLWPKLLRASAVEALAKGGAAGAPVAKEAVVAFLADAESGKPAAVQPRVAAFNGQRAQIVRGHINAIATRRATELRAQGDVAQAAEIEQGAGAEAVTAPARVEQVTQETEKNLFFETRDRAAGGKWIHRNYVAK